MNYLAMCCIVKDEGPFLREWLAYHAHIGVEHFFLYDNGSTLPVSESLGEFASSGMVTILGVSGKAMQLTAYNYCLSEFGSRCFWIAFCDADEFICPRDANDLRVALTEFEEYGGLGLSWRVFGSAGREKRPEGLVIDAYTQYLTQPDPHIKSIVRPDKVTGCRNAHSFGYIHDACCVSENHEPIPAGSPFWLPSHKRLWVNHYFYKSREDFADKLSRGRNSPRLEATNQWNMDIFDRHLGQPTAKDTTITRFSPSVRAALHAPALPAPFIPCPTGASLEHALQAVSTHLERGDFAGAQVALCHVAARWPQLAEIEALRASLARATGNLDLADRFLRRAFMAGEGPELYAEMFQISRSRGDKAQAAAACSLLRLWMERNGGEASGWLDKLIEMEKQV